MATADVLRLTISLASKAATRAGFGQALTLAKNVPLVSWGDDRIKSTTFDESGRASVKTNFGPDSEEYAWITQALSQKGPRPLFAHFGLREAAVAVQKTLTQNEAIESGQTLNATINGKTVTQAWDTDASTTYAAFRVKLLTCPGVSAVVISTNNFQITGVVEWPLNVSFSVTGTGSLPTTGVSVVAAGRTVFTDVDELATLSRLWYMLTSLDYTGGHIWEAARAVQASDRMFLPVTLDTDAYDDTATLDIMNRLKDLGYDRTAVTFHDTASEYIDAAIVGRFLGLRIGQQIWTNKPLTGVNLPDIDADQAQAIKDKNGNLYNAISGRAWYNYGRTADGGFIDTRINLDYMLVYTREYILDQMEKQNIVPYTQKGVDTVRGWVIDQLQTFKERDGILAYYDVPEIDASKIPDDKQDNRILPDVTFSAKFTGAIQEVEVAGTVEA